MKNRKKPARPIRNPDSVDDGKTVQVSLERLPRSATHPLIAVSGLMGFFAGVALIYYVRPFETVAYDAMFLIGCVALGVFLPDLAWRKVWRNTSAGLGRSPANASWSRTIIKFIGLTGSLMCVGFLYWLFPEYTTQSSFYHPFFDLLQVLLPLMLALAIPYIYWVDQRMEQPEDGLWHFGKALLFQSKVIHSRVISQHLLGWLIKGFFLPLMFGYLCADTLRLYNYDFAKLVNFRGIWEFLFFFLFYVDVVFGTMGYVMSLRLLDTHIRSSEPTLLGWSVAVVCYEPFWNVIGRQYLSYDSGYSWGRWLWDQPLIHAFWGTAILVLTGIYVWATVIFGGRFSNLTHRGIITSGPYRYTKHPAYIAKSLSWWLIAVPFVISDSAAVTLRHCLALIMVNGIYYLRAKTEERHLSLDPDYVHYSRWIEKHGCFRRLNRLPVVGALMRFRLADYR